MNRVKLGEVFQIAGEKYEFICVHCSKEFGIFAEFTFHVQQHFINAFKDLRGCAEFFEKENDAIIKSEIDIENVVEALDNDNRSEDDTSYYMDKNNYTDYDSDPVKDERLKEPVKKKENRVRFIEGKDYKRDGNIYHCLYCSRIIKNKKLREHLVTHTNKKNKRCPICDKKFTLLCYVKKHLLVVHKRKYSIDMIREAQNYELNDKQSEYFECHICKKTMTGETMSEMRNSLKCHLRTAHQSENCLYDGNLYECLICNRGFKKKHILSEHLLIHKYTEKNKRCPLCDMKYQQTRYVQKHLWKVHQKKYTMDMVREAQIEFDSDDKNEKREEVIKCEPAI